MAISSIHSSSTPVSSKIWPEMNSKRRLPLQYFIVLIYFYMLSGARATVLPDSEVEALKEIWQTLGKKDWDFGVDPCSDEQKWTKKDGFNNDVITNVTCNCTTTVCHVVSIVLKAQSLPGVLPPELVKLPHLQAIDLTRNYLNGSIPKAWGSMQLVNITLLGNRVSGQIPAELGNITTLKLLELDFNQLSGALPHELGNMTSIEKITLTSNNFTGPLPDSLAKLITLKDFRISSNNFSGTVPNFLQDLINLEKLVIQASGLQGPIPKISMLTKLTDLRISYLNGLTIAFPPLRNMKNLKTLILRSCNINDTIPSYLGDLAKLKTLDLSFNNLMGVLPKGLEKVKFFYLTGNAFSGPVPDWILNSGRKIDLSYNNFTLGASDSRCQQRSVNFFGSPLVKNNSTSAGIAPCLKSFKCPRKYHEFHINCGGSYFEDGSTKYEEDKDPAGASLFYQSRSNWAFSSTGDFMDNDNEDDIYIVRNVSSLSMKNYQLYTVARVSPVSLTYYGFCLLNNNNYSVSLHFAEIMFTNDRNYSSLGRRIFDIYIQGKLVQKDFNIKDEAGGAGKNVTKKYTAMVTDGTLEIRFHWAGKGTEGIPSRGTYGPLVSAISVDPDFKPPSGNKISPGIVVVIVLSTIVFIIIFAGILWWKSCFRQKNEIDKDLRGLDLQTGTFTLSQLKAATNNFAPENKIGEGGFGSVYKGNLLDGTIIAVKQLSAKSKQGNREFVNEIGMISALQHPNLVKLYGCCIEGNQLLLVYEYMENNSLARVLFGHEEYHLMLDWPTRHKICVGLAKALAYLHEESRLKIVHRDIKATNVLLDKDLNAKVSDFGLAKLDEEDNSHISTRIAGTFGYMAPEYAMKGYLTDKADVYSFGVVALEIVSGRSNTNHKAKEGCVYLLEWALMLQEKGDLTELVDPMLKSNYNKEEVLVMIDVALQCTNATPTLRPIMSSVVSMLEGRTGALKFVLDSSISGKDTETKAIRDQYHFSPSTDQTRSMLSDGPWTETSASSSDLYPMKPDSQYWNSRDETSL